MIAPRHLDPAGSPFADRQRAPRWSRVLIATCAVVAVALLAATGGLLWGQRGAERFAVPDANSVDVGFAQDMSVHHLNAVQMASWTRDLTTDPAIRQLAYDIESGQTAQVGQMQGWLNLWGAAPQATGGYMTWMPATTGMAMGQPSDGVAQMPGMASTQDLAALRASSGPAADVMFLQLMLRHHSGGAAMLRYAADRATQQQVRNLAEKMLTSQTAESDLLRQMLTQRGAAPLPS